MTGESEFVHSLVVSYRYSAARGRNKLRVLLRVEMLALNSRCYIKNMFHVYVFHRPFRRVTDKGALLWDRIHRLEKGKIYQQVARASEDVLSEASECAQVFNFYCAHLFAVGKPL